LPTHLASAELLLGFPRTGMHGPHRAPLRVLSREHRGAALLCHALLHALLCDEPAETLLPKHHSPFGTAAAPPLVSAAAGEVAVPNVRSMYLASSFLPSSDVMSPRL